MKRIHAGVWGGASVLVFALVFFVYSFQYPWSSEIGPGPGFFPLILSGLLVLLSLVYLYQAFKGRDSAEEMPDRKGQKLILFILMAMVLYVILLPILGFNLASAAFLFALLFKSYGWRTNLLISVGSAVFLYVLFARMLDVQLPVNKLGF